MKRKTELYGDFKHSYDAIAGCYAIIWSHDSFLFNQILNSDDYLDPQIGYQISKRSYSINKSFSKCIDQGMPEIF